LGLHKFPVLICNSFQSFVTLNASEELQGGVCSLSLFSLTLLQSLRRTLIRGGIKGVFQGWGKRVVHLFFHFPLSASVEWKSQQCVKRHPAGI